MLCLKPFYIFGRFREFQGCITVQMQHLLSTQWPQDKVWDNRTVLSSAEGYKHFCQTDSICHGSDVPHGFIWDVIVSLTVCNKKFTNILIEKIIWILRRKHIQLFSDFFCIQQLCLFYGKWNLFSISIIKIAGGIPHRSILIFKRFPKHHFQKQPFFREHRS